MGSTENKLLEGGTQADTTRETAPSGCQSRIGESSAFQTTMGPSQAAAEDPRQGKDDAWGIGRWGGLEMVDDEDLVEDAV